MRERYVELPETETSMNVRLLHVVPRRWYMVPRRWYVIFATGGAEIPRKNKLSTHRMCNSTETCRKSQMKRTMFKKEIHCVNKVGKCLNFQGYTTSCDWRTARSILCTSANQEEFFHSNNEQEGLSNVILIYTDVCRLGIKSSRLGQRIYHSTEILA